MNKHLVKAGFLAGILATSGGLAAAEEGAAQAAGNKSVEEKAAPCVACHGEKGVSPTAAFPIIAGQHASYLEKAMKDYRDGARKNAVMAGQAANLSDQDIKALAAYYARQKGPLYTPAGD